jgi:molecular chaperone GrpE
MTLEEDPSDIAEEQRQETPVSEAAEAPSFETLQAELEEANREIGQFKALAQRAQADLANYRRRVEEEREQVYHSIATRFINKLLPILDDLQRAVEHVPDGAEEAQWLEGIQLIERSLQAVMETEGVVPIEADGKPFDPWEHEALYSVRSLDNAAGTVVSVIRPGYKLHGRVLRAAQVTVAQDVETEEQEPPDSTEAHSPDVREE